MITVYQIQTKRNGEWIALSCVVRKSKQETEAMLADILADNAKLGEDARIELRIAELLLG
jgi:hypothetical protein